MTLFAGISFINNEFDRIGLGKLLTLSPALRYQPENEVICG